MRKASLQLAREYTTDQYSFLNSKRIIVDSKVKTLVKISNREQEILQLICKQYTTPEIAEQLSISPRTVDGHRNRLLAKLNCRNTVGLVIYAIKNQIVDIV